MQNRRSTIDRRFGCINLRVNLCAVLAPPGKQIGREIRCGATLARGAGRQRLRIELGLDRLAMVMHAIPDIRMLIENDVRFLSHFK